jgi:uncharacterized membrane protein
MYLMLLFTGIFAGVSAVVAVSIWAYLRCKAKRTERVDREQREFLLEPSKWLNQ